MKQLNDPFIHILTYKKMSHYNLLNCKELFSYQKTLVKTKELLPACLIQNDQTPPVFRHHLFYQNE